MVTIEDLGRRRHGAFGERLITGLLETTRLEVIIAGRDEARLVALVARCNHTARTVGPMRVAAQCWTGGVWRPTSSEGQARSRW